jgi:hypothetical protein
MDVVVYVVAFVLLFCVVGELWDNHLFAEGFTDGAAPEYFGRFFPKRADVTPGQDREDGGWIRNPRYSEAYVDVQNLGYKADFCRVIEKEGQPESRMVACALAGQEGLDPYVYRTENQRSGFRFSRDDYYRDVNGDGKDDYGRILKMTPAPKDTWEARVVLAGLTRFKQGMEVTDTSPPPDIADLLWFFEGTMLWFRWFDDMLDYSENARLQIAGKAAVDETTRRTKTKGLQLNRLRDEDVAVKPFAEQYLAVGENPAMEFDTKVQVRELRAFCAWINMDAFSNNARFFDFGNGAGKSNVFVGIEGRGPQVAFGAMGPRPGPTNEVCSRNPAVEQLPLDYLKTSDADVDNLDCSGLEDIPSTYPSDEKPGAVPDKANLIFEIWDTEQRKMRIRVLQCIPKRRWFHLAITTTDNDAFRPTWHIYVDGVKIFEELDGHMPMTSLVTKNFIGRSNWEDVSSQYADGDERFRGSMYDFRLYRKPMSAAKIKRTVEWGKTKLEGMPEAKSK